jgi:predicted RNA binding protein YcfA (HicA-like mRNA interferase family)
VGSGFYFQLRAVLLAHGCERVRQAKGSHEIWYSPVNRARFAVSVTVNNRHTANGILKQAGIGKQL